MIAERSYDVIVAGAGITGASIAWHASQKGLKVAILDAKGPAAAASGASDGAVSVASKKPGIMAKLAGESLAYCRSLAGNGQVLDGVFHSRPSFVFSTCSQEDDALDRLSAMLADPDLPVRIERDSSAEDARLSGLGSAVARVTELAGEGHMLGYEAVYAFLSLCQADTFWPLKLAAFDTSQSRVWLETDQGEMTAEKLVIATGLGAVSLFPDLPLFPRSGQLIVTDRSTGAGWTDLPGPLTSAAYLLNKSTGSKSLTQAPVVIDPLRTGQILIGSSREDGGTEMQTDFRTVRRSLKSGIRCLPALAQRRVIRVFAGVRAASVDGYPIVGALAEAPNVVLATGFEGDGICLSAIVGREISEMLFANPPAFSMDALSPNRFSGITGVAQ